MNSKIGIERKQYIVDMKRGEWNGTWDTLACGNVNGKSSKGNPKQNKVPSYTYYTYVCEKRKKEKYIPIKKNWNTLRNQDFGDTRDQKSSLYSWLQHVSKMNEWTNLKRGFYFVICRCAFRNSGNHQITRPELRSCTKLDPCLRSNLARHLQTEISPFSPTNDRLLNILIMTSL